MRYSPTRLAGIVTRTMSSVTTVGFGAGRRLSGWCPHTYRKTVATMLDRQGLSARTIADQLGHARISMTQDVYMGRRAVDQAAAVYWKASHHRDMTVMTSRLPCSRSWSRSR